MSTYLESINIDGTDFQLAVVSKPKQIPILGVYGPNKWHLHNKQNPILDLGYMSTMIGDWSVDLGAYNETKNDGEIVLGSYNRSWSGSNSAEKTKFSIGAYNLRDNNGLIPPQSTERKNLFEIMQNGDVYVNGLGDYDGTNGGNIHTNSLQKVINNKANISALSNYLPLSGGILTGDIKLGENISTGDSYKLILQGTDSNTTISANQQGYLDIQCAETFFTINGGYGYINGNEILTSASYFSDFISPNDIGAAASSHTHSASDITSGTLAIERIPTGTTSSTVALGNHTHSNYLTSSSLSGYATQSWVEDQGYLTSVPAQSWSSITGKPSTFTPAAHNQASNTITALTGYSEGTATTTLTATMSLNAALASLQNQIQGKASSLSDLGVTATAAEINKLDGLTATTTELNYVDGVTSNIQTQLNGKSARTHNHSYATTSVGGFMSAADKTKLDGIRDGADSVSFNGSLSSGTKIGTIEINGVTTTIYVPTNIDTKNTTGTSNSDSKLYLAGGTSQSSTGVVTYSNSSVYTQSGQLYASVMNTTNGFYETSDARLKNFKDDVKALEVVSEIPTKYFTWKKDKVNENMDPQLHIGTSAQEIQKIYPDLVSENGDGHLTVDYARLSVVALAAIKELKMEIDELKNKIIGGLNTYGN